MLDGVGMQSHINANYDGFSGVSAYTAAMKKFLSIGCDVQITELDITMENGKYTLQQQADKYKYATGISASLALAKRVTEGGAQERDDYFKFLKSGGSRYPIESLRVAGVDMESSAPVQAALDTFRELVDSLEKEL